MYDLAQLPPWLRPVWQRLQQLSAKPPAALLLSSAQNGDAHALATPLLSAILCTADVTERPCGQCRDCREVAAGTHPDLKHLQRPEDKREIVVDQIRQASQWSTKTARAGRRVLYIQHADELNRSAANAFLKTLEEPALGLCIVLSTRQWHRLPQTIRSRCVRIDVPAPGKQVFVGWAQQQGWSSTRIQDALEWAPGDALSAAQLSEQTQETLARWRQAWRRGVEQGDTFEAAAMFDADDWPLALRWLQRRTLEWARSGAAAVLEEAWTAMLRQRRGEAIATNRLLSIEALIILLRRAHQKQPFAMETAA